MKLGALFVSLTLLSIPAASDQRLTIRISHSPADGTRPSYPVGTPVVMLRDPDSLKMLYRGRVDAPIALDRAEIADLMDDSIGQMFARYPTRREAAR